MFDVAAFRHLLFSTAFVKPAWTTLWTTFAAMGIGMSLGLFGALGAGARFRWLRLIVAAYLWVFRGIPTLVQIVFWYDALPQLTGNAINMPAIVAGVIALGVNEGAYMTEIVRAGLLSIDGGQKEAARALGMTAPLMMRRIVIPQALRVIIPPTGNQFINMLKTTSLLFTIAVPEIFATGTNIYSANFRYFEVLSVMSIWYLILTTFLTIVVRALEWRFGIEWMNARNSRGGVLARLFGANPVKGLGQWL